MCSHHDPTSPIRFLLVDDRDENLLALESLLARDGLECIKTRSGREALEALLVDEVSLAIVDVQMPEMNGFELAELMRGSERTRRIPIIFVTAGVRDTQRLFKGYEAGAVDFLFKPIDPHVLRNKVETFYQLSRQRQELAIELERRNLLTEELAESLRVCELFVATLGHDMRTPLAAVVAGAQVIAARAPDPGLKELAGRVRAGGERMSEMLDDLYDLARARLGGGIPIACARIDLATVVTRVVAEHRDAAAEQRIVVDRTGDLEGYWDPERLSQVLDNLLGNAIRHGDGTVRMTLDGTNPSSVVISVNNPGVIPPEVAPHLFEPFRSGRTPRRRSESLGLGLYIVQEIVTAHGGRVECTSDADGGTTFRVTLPRDPNADLHANAHAHPC